MEVFSGEKRIGNCSNYQTVISVRVRLLFCRLLSQSFWLRCQHGGHFSWIPIQVDSELAKHWSSWSHLEELRRMWCLVLDKFLRLQFLFCSIWVWHFLRPGTRVFYGQLLVGRWVLWIGIWRIEIACEIVHHWEINACLSRQWMCDRYHRRPTIVSITYSLGSLSKWASSPVYVIILLIRYRA